MKALLLLAALALGSTSSVPAPVARLRAVMGDTITTQAQDDEMWALAQKVAAEKTLIGWSGAKLTANFALTDAAYRNVLFAKAALNITDSSISSINAILMALFGGYGNCYVRDNEDMTMTFVLGAAPSKVDYAIITQSGVLPQPVGVSFTVEYP